MIRAQARAPIITRVVPAVPPMGRLALEPGTAAQEPAQALVLAAGEPGPEQELAPGAGEPAPVRELVQAPVAGTAAPEPVQEQELAPEPGEPAPVAKTPGRFTDLI